jgi:thiol-disulfide isomerase/thioredoxin
MLLLLYKMPREIITELSIENLQKLQAEMGKHILVIKFGADWCGPCKKIAPIFYDFIEKSPTNIIFADINVDENIDLYMTLKKHKMVNGIPVFFAFYGDEKRDKWFIPEDSVIGADEISVKAFFDRTKIKAIDLCNSHETYSYYS